MVLVVLPTISKTTIHVSNPSANQFRDLKVLDYRVVPYTDGDIPYAFINVVFKANSDFKHLCDSLSKDYTEVRVANSHDMVEEYLVDLRHSFADDSNFIESTLSDGTSVYRYTKNDNLYEKVFHKAYDYHFSPLLKYIPKFDVFSYREYVSWTNTTKGACQDLKDICEGINNFRFTEESVFINLLKTLNNLWD